jgi:hypothetical protein
VRGLVAIALVLAACCVVFAQPQAPRADHHQHLFSPLAIANNVPAALM